MAQPKAIALRVKLSFQYNNIRANFFFYNNYATMTQFLHEGTTKRNKKTKNVFVCFLFLFSSMKRKDEKKRLRRYCESLIAILKMKVT